jgi:hypothetical protein
MAVIILYNGNLDIDFFVDMAELIVQRHELNLITEIRGRKFFNTLLEM